MDEQTRVDVVRTMLAAADRRRTQPTKKLSPDKGRGHALDGIDYVGGYQSRQLRRLRFPHSGEK
jgi:hypothetical protein